MTKDAIKAFIVPVFLRAALKDLDRRYTNLFKPILRVLCTEFSLIVRTNVCGLPIFRQQTMYDSQNIIRVHLILHLNLKRLGAALIAEKFEWRTRLTAMSVRKYVNEDG